MAESVAAVVLALFAAAVWAGSIVVTRRALLAGATPLQATLASAAVNVALYWTALGALVALGGMRLVIVPAIFAAFLASGVVGTTGARLVSNRGIERLGASVNAAGISTRPLFATALAWALLAEPVTVPIAAGVAVLVAGVALLSLSRGGNVAGWSKASLALPLAAAALFAVSDVLRRFGLTVAPVSALQGVAIHEAAGLVGLLAVAAARGFSSTDASRSTPGGGLLDVPTAAGRPLVVGGGLFGLAMLLFVEALRRGRVAVVTTIAGTAPLFVVVLARVLLPGVERITRGTVAATLLIVLGGGLIVLA